MKVDVKKVDALGRELRFEVSGDRVAKKLNEVYEGLGKVAKIKGFRQGKVPRDVLEKKHGDLAKEETLKKLIPEVYHEGIHQVDLSPIDLPEILDVSFKDGIIKFTAKIDVRPEVKVGEYKRLKVTRKSAEVTEDDLNKTLDYFKQAQGNDKEVKVDDEFAKGLGYPDLKTFKDALKSQLAIDKDRQNRFDLENQIVDQLLKKARLVVPQALAKKQLERRVAEMKHRMKHQGLSEEEIEKQDDKIRKELRDTVDRDIKVFFVLEKIAELEKITAENQQGLPHKVIEFLLKEADWEDEKSKSKTKEEKKQAAGQR